MKRIVVFQHVAHEILGTLHPLLRNAGFRIRHVNFGRHPDATVDIERYDGLVILGGPMGVYETKAHPHLTEELRCIEKALELDKPVLGICLGAQLVAAALGAKVAKHSQGEVGWHEVSTTAEGVKDKLLETMSPRENIFQWHGDAFDLPDGAAWLARSERCPNQAFRYGDKVYGFQFHLEVDEHMIERWLRLLEIREAAFSAEKLAKIDRIRDETARYIDSSIQLSQKVFQRYISLFSTKRRTLLLGSGHK